MKSILLYANDDVQLESRLSAALDLTRLVDGRLTCLQVTPFDSFIMGDPFGGIYALPSVVEHVAKAEGEHRARIEQRLREAGVRWSWTRCDGSPDQALMRYASLADVILLSLPDREDERTLAMIGSVALAARAPVLGIPAAATGFRAEGAALVAWNGSAEAAHALRLSLPLLGRAAQIHVVCIGAEPTEIPAQAALDYLGEHGIAAEQHQWAEGDGDVPESLLAAAQRLDATWIVLGAYGHSRFREAVLGGATRGMLARSPIPLLLAH